MQNLKKLEKSRGILAFAYNTETTDYESIAHRTLAVASKILKLPYTLITERDIPCNSNNTRYDVDTNTFVQWRNQGRHLAYELSPYDETLVIDVDYLILDDKLLNIFEQPLWDYLLQRDSHALTTTWTKNMGANSLPYVWATVFAFRKTRRAELFFKLVGKVQRNYGYYHSLFNMQERNYRNDYSFAVADTVINGSVIGTESIAGSMLAINQPINTISIQNNNIIVKDITTAYVLPRTNLHIMSKAYLQSEDFIRLVEQVLNESA